MFMFSQRKALLFDYDIIRFSFSVGLKDMRHQNQTEQKARRKQSIFTHYACVHVCVFILVCPLTQGAAADSHDIPEYRLCLTGLMNICVISGDLSFLLPRWMNSDLVVQDTRTLSRTILPYMYRIWDTAGGLLQGLSVQGTNLWAACILGPFKSVQLSTGETPCFQETSYPRFELVNSPIWF